MLGKTLQLGLAGLGTVGSGVYETLCRNHDLLEARARISYQIRKVAVHSLTRKREVEVSPELLTDRWQDLVEDPEIDIIIELIGGVTEAYALIKAALRQGKPVVTGNKAVLATYGSELFRLSSQMHTPLYFEASCGGGIPIVQSLQKSLICNNVLSIVGIINGTTNYILSSMAQRGISYSQALAEAQEQGYAELDPTLDVSGWDAAYKALILAMLAYGTPLKPDCLSVFGIERMERDDFEFADKLGYTIKLLVVIKHHQEGDALELRVQPSLVPKRHLLANVDGVFNAIAVEGDIVGETIFYGRGAGKNPTASAVIGDLVLAMRELPQPEYHTGFRPYTNEMRVLPIDETETPCYVRFRVQDRPGVIAKIASALGKYDIGIRATTSTCYTRDQKGVVWNNLVFIVHSCKWGRLKWALSECCLSDWIAPEPIVLRIETLNE